MDITSSSLITAQNLLTRYGMTTYVILGSIGLFLNMSIFSQSVYRRNSNLLYLLSMSLCNLFSLNFGTIPIIYALDHVNPLTNSLILCKLQFYFRHTPYQMMRTFMILACINRYISSNVRHRFHFLINIK
jgi:hypothetical protein